MEKSQHIVARFAPSPNGLLHLGHGLAAMHAHDFARDRGGRFLLRIEDIDGERSRPEFIAAILADLRWLGLDWDGEPVFQSDRLDSYAQAADRLRAMELLYPCFCTRKEIAAVQAERQVADGPDGPVYPGTCRGLNVAEREAMAQQRKPAWRLDMAKATARAGPLCWHDEAAGEQIATPAILGDVVLVRKDAPASYHLAATLDDAADGISHVVRGADLFAATHIHRLLQALLDLPVPRYFHHALLIDDNGQKLSKSHASPPLSALREAGEDGMIVLSDLREGKLPFGISLKMPKLQS